MILGELIAREVIKGLQSRAGKAREIDRALMIGAALPIFIRLYKIGTANHVDA